jgi:Arm DNA-binding domain
MTTHIGNPSCFRHASGYRPPFWLTTQRAEKTAFSAPLRFQAVVRPEFVIATAGMRDGAPPLLSLGFLCATMRHDAPPYRVDASDRLPEVLHGRAKMNATRAQLSEMQEDIAKGRMPDGVRDGDYVWHRHFRLALRPYNTGRGIWVVKYYNKAGDERSYKIGSAAAINLTAAEKIAKDIFGRVARGEDPAGERKRPKGRRSVGELLRLFCESEQGLLEIGENGPRYADPTKRAYRKLEKRYLGSLAHVDSIELCERQNDIVDHITKITEKVSPFVARQVRNQLSRIFMFGMRRFPDDYKKNPVVGTWMPEAPAADKRSLDLDELAAICRAGERMTGTAVPLYKGNPNGTPVPIPANSIRADDTLLTVREAARQCGLEWGTLKMEIAKDRIPIMSRHELPAHHPILIGHHHPHNTQFIKAADLNEFVKMRTVLTRSGAGDYGMIVRLLMLLGRRYSEMGGLRWGELECECEVCRRDRKEFRHRTLHIRTVAEEDEHRRVKSRHGWKKDVFVYLPQAAIDILDQAKRRPGISCLFGDDPRDWWSKRIRRTLWMISSARWRAATRSVGRLAKIGSQNPPAVGAEEGPPAFAHCEGSAEDRVRCRSIQALGAEAVEYPSAAALLCHAYANGRALPALAGRRDCKSLRQGSAEDHGTLHAYRISQRSEALPRCLGAAHSRRSQRRPTRRS